MLYSVTSHIISFLLSFSFKILDDEERKQQVIDGKFWGFCFDRIV